MADIAGWFGAALLLLAYVLNGAGLLLSHSTALHIANLLGAILVAMSAAAHGARPLVVLNTLWAIFAAVNVVRSYFASLSRSLLMSPLKSFIWKNLPRSDAEFAQLAAAHRSNQSSSNADKDLITHLYGCLSSIDSKAGALLTTNSLWVAVIAIFAASDSIGFDKKSPWELLAAVSSFVFIATSAGMALFTIYVRWSTPTELDDPLKLADTLLRIRASRTALFRLAVMSCGIGSLILSCFVVSKFLVYLNLLQWN